MTSSEPQAFSAFGFHQWRTNVTLEMDAEWWVKVESGATTQAPYTQAPTEPSTCGPLTDAFFPC